MHMRPTKVVRTTPDQSPIVGLRTPEKQYPLDLSTVDSPATPYEPQESQPSTGQEKTEKTVFNNRGSSLGMTRPRRMVWFI